MPDAARIHATATVERGAVVGPGTAVWHHAHLRGGTDPDDPNPLVRPARVGRDCIVGGGTSIACGVVVGDRCKLNAGVFIPAGVRLGVGVMVSAGTIFTNDRFPRACEPELDRLRGSAPDDATLVTQVADGVTFGAGAIVGPGLRIGAFAMIGMGAVVTRDVPAHALVVGNPARLAGAVCRCGERVWAGDIATLRATYAACEACGRGYHLTRTAFDTLRVAEADLSTGEVRR